MNLLFECSVGVVAFFLFGGVFLKVLLKFDMLIKCFILCYGYLKKLVILFKYRGNVTWLMKSSQLGCTTRCQSKVLNGVMFKLCISFTSQETEGSVSVLKAVLVFLAAEILEALSVPQVVHKLF